MDNIFAITIFGLLVIVLLLFIIIRNKKDRKDLENQLNQDYKKTKDEEGDVETDLKAD